MQSSPLKKMHLVSCLFVVTLVTKCIQSMEYGENTLSDEDPNTDLAFEDFYNAVGTDFIEFNRLSDSTDSFILDNMEYIFVSFKMRYKYAKQACKYHYDGQLAVLEENNTLWLVSEALSETRLNLDTLWISGIKHDNTSEWMWEENGQMRPINETFLELITTNPSVPVYPPVCLGFGRSYHAVPQFRPLECKARRSFLCQRSKSGGYSGNDTHPGWIPIGQRLYKIIDDRVPYKMGSGRCVLYDLAASLAVIDDFNTSQQLGRYLLIGRPSLENAWIGARWIDDGYRFEPEDVILSNTTQANKFPPWKNGHVSKVDGCVLLDRHLANITLFVESNCNRPRPIICYKMSENENDANSEIIDVFIKEFGYRVQLKEKPWDEAVTYCRDNYVGKNGSIAEVTDDKQRNNLMYIMSEFRTALQHIWVGGKYYPALGWMWESGKRIDGSLIILNTTYDDIAEEKNTCLNMDRENHLTSMFYGTACEYPQVFICAFPTEQLRKIEEEEKINKTKNRNQNTKKLGTPMYESLAKTTTTTVPASAK